MRVRGARPHAEAGRVVARQAAAGALAGVLVFLLLEPVRRAYGGGWGDLFDGLPDLFLPGIAAGGLMTALLVVAEELATRSVLRISRRAIGGGVVGGILGAGYSVIGHALYDVLRGSPGDFGAPIAQVIARAGGWSILGLGVGLSAGLASASGRRSYQGCAGGLLGGLAAGLIFEAVARLTGHGGARLLLGFVILGGCVGAATALVEQFSRRAWLTFLTGAREGQAVNLHRDTVTLGRDELADIPLFGDGSVERAHAVVTLAPAPCIREVALRPQLRLDGRPVRESPLSDGSIIEIGKHRLRFGWRGLLVPASDFVPPIARALGEALAEQPTGPPFSPTGLTRRTGQTGLPSASGAQAQPRVAQLRVFLAGRPLAVIPFAAEITVGRELGNTLQLPDAKASRYHARIEAVDGAWVLTDVGSTNGTRLNGLRVTRAGLLPGDRIEIGDTLLVVEMG